MPIGPSRRPRRRRPARSRRGRRRRAGTRVRGAARGRDRRPRPPRHRVVAVARRDERALLREQLGDRPAHAARGAGDDRDPPGDAAVAIGTYAAHRPGAGATGGRPPRPTCGQRAAHVLVAGHVEAKRQLLALADAEPDAARDTRTRRRRDAVVDDADPAAHEIGAVVRAVDAERLTEPARARAEVAVALGRRRAARASRRSRRAAPRPRSSTACGCSPGPHTAFMHQ